MRVADFSGARLHDLAAKGTQEALGQYYNPDGVYEAVTRFTPHAEDIEFSEYFLKDKVNIRPFTVSLLNPMKIFRGMRSILRGFKADDIDVVRGRNTYTASLGAPSGQNWPGFLSWSPLAGTTGFRSDATAYTNMTASGCPTSWNGSC